MDPVDRYVREVLRNIHLPQADRQRIEADLRAHVQEATAAGQPLTDVLKHMGSPAEVAAGFMSQATLRYAGFGRRLLAFAIDMLIILAVDLVLAFLIVLGGSWLDAIDPLSFPLNGLRTLLAAILVLLIVGAAAALLGTTWLYFPILEARFEQTAGKRLLRLVVLREDGMPIGFKEAFLRRISYYFDIFPIDALFIVFTAKRQRAFDIVARTVVVHEG